MRFKLENEYFKAKADEINLASEARSTEEEFRLAKSFTSLNRVDKPLVSKQALEDHFAKHFSQREVEKPPEIINPEAFEHILPPADLPTVDESAPDEAEIQRITSKFKNGKCQGTDKIKSEQLKYSTSAQLLLYLGILMSTIWSTMKIPANWLAATITCLHKKGSKSRAENYRGISIMSSCSKLLSMTCVERIRERYEQLLLPTQYGFRANRSTTDAIYILRHVLEKTTTPLFVCFIDLRAAYDWIPRELLFEVLLIRLKSPKIVELLKLLYTGTKACIKGTKTYFDTWVGCRQGALESPTIFNIYLDFVVRVAREEVLKKLPNAGALIEYIIPTVVAPRRLRKGPLRGENRILELLYADDEVVFGNSLEELIQILEIYDKTFTRFGLTMAYKKTETMPFNVHPDMLEADSLLQINNVPIKNVRTFKYLGQGVTNHPLNKHLNGNYPIFLN